LVSRHIHELGMPGGRFSIALEARPAADYSPHGMEQVEFLVGANPGQPPRPLAKVASGGELSRISLAIQVVAARDVRVPTLIFDEVDAGIGGGVAEMVGKQLRSLGGSHQVLCVTHLPQVAALAHHHWQVSKQTRNGETFTAVAALSETARCEEIARMLGGVEITRQTRAHAKEMIARAKARADLGEVTS
jgi:DNA repair protein RecN (Recombination protein N)